MLGAIAYSNLLVLVATVLGIAIAGVAIRRISVIGVAGVCRAVVCRVGVDRIAVVIGVGVPRPDSKAGTTDTQVYA